MIYNYNRGYFLSNIIILFDSGKYNKIYIKKIYIHLMYL